MARRCRRARLAIVIGCLWLLSAPGAAQGPSPDLRQAVAHARVADKRQHSFKARVASVAAHGRAIQADLARLLSEGDVDPVVLTALGCVSTPDDVVTIRELGALAYSERNPHRLWALEALIRIGGTALDEALHRLARGEGGVEAALFMVDHVWQLGRVADLRRARVGLRRVERSHPSSATATLVRETGLPRVEVALRVATRPTALATRALLVEILNQRAPEFASMAAGVARGWAADRLVEAAGSAAAPPLRELLEGYHARQVRLAAGLHKRLLLALRRAGGVLAESEQRWLHARSGLDPHPLALHWRGEDLRAWQEHAGRAGDR